MNITAGMATVRNVSVFLVDMESKFFPFFPQGHYYYYFFVVVAEGTRNLASLVKMTDNLPNISIPLIL